MIAGILAGLKAIPALITLVNSLNDRISQLEATIKRSRDEEFFRESKRLREMLEKATTPEEKHEAAKLASDLVSRL